MAQANLDSIEIFVVRVVTRGSVNSEPFDSIATFRAES